MVGKEQTMKTLSHTDLRTKCPAIFQETPDSKVSAKYGVVKTIDVIEQVQAQGWNPINCWGGGLDAQGMHYVTLVNESLKLGNGMSMTMTFVNSLDRTAKARFLKGAYRPVCSNSLVMNPKNIGQIENSKKKNGFGFVHLIHNVTHIPQVLGEYMESLEATQAQIETQSRVVWSDTKTYDFAKMASALRGSSEGVDLGSLLVAIRPEDEGNNALRVFNRVQEKVLGGGYTKTIINKGKDGALVPYQMPMKGIENAKRRLDINMKLWGLYESFTEAQ